MTNSDPHWRCVGYPDGDGGVKFKLERYDPFTNSLIKGEMFAISRERLEQEHRDQAKAFNRPSLVWMPPRLVEEKG